MSRGEVYEQERLPGKMKMKEGVRVRKEALSP